MGDSRGRSQTISGAAGKKGRLSVGKSARQAVRV